MRYFYILFVVTIVATLVPATQSKCRPATPLKNFRLDKLQGLWYKFASYSHHFESGCDCFTSLLEITAENRLNAIGCCQMSRISNETQFCQVGITAVTLQKSKTMDANLRYTRTGTPVESHTWVIDTDYDNYFIPSGCDRANGKEVELFWVFLRRRQITRNLLNKIKKIAKKHGFDPRKILKQKQGLDVCKTRRPPPRHRH